MDVIKYYKSLLIPFIFFRLCFLTQFIWQVIRTSSKGYTRRHRLFEKPFLSHHTSMELKKAFFLVRLRFLMHTSPLDDDLLHGHDVMAPKNKGLG